MDQNNKVAESPFAEDDNLEVLDLDPEANAEIDPEEDPDVDPEAEELEEDDENDPDGEDEDLELSDEELDELLEDLDEDDPDADEQVQTVPHAALHKERERRKELQTHLTLQQTELQGVNERLQNYENSFESIEKQIKELGLEDVVKLDKPAALDPDAVAYKAQQSAQREEQLVIKNVGEIREEAMGFITEFPMISSESAEHEEIVIGLSLAAMSFGADAEEATQRAMTTLNKALTLKSKAALRQRKPLKKNTPPGGGGKRKVVRRVKAKPGNVSGVFADIANDHLG